MQTINLTSIKWESVKSIFTAIANAEQISRAEISHKTGLSLVTVGKVADALLTLDIVQQNKEVKASAGRRASLLNINQSKYAVILDLSDKHFRFSILNLGLDLMENNQFTGHLDRLYEDNLHDFLSDTYAYIEQNYDLSNCFGIGISLPGPYDPKIDSTASARIPAIRNVRLHEIIDKYFPNLPIYMDASENVAALSNISAIPDYINKNILYWFIGDEVTTGSLMIKGEFIDGYKRPPCNFGQLILPNGNKLETALHRCRTPSEMASIISHPLYNIIQIIQPHVIILECETMHTLRDDVVAELKQLLHEKYHQRYDHIPDIMSTHCKFRHSHRGLAMQLRTQWIDRMILKDN